MLAELNLESAGWLIQTTGWKDQAGAWPHEGVDQAVAWTHASENCAMIQPEDSHSNEGESPRIDTRPEAVRGMEIASRIISACLTPVIPIALGYGLDTWMKWGPWASILGGLLAALIAWQLFRGLLASLNRNS